MRLPHSQYTRDIFSCFVPLHHSFLKKCEVTVSHVPRAQVFPTQEDLVFSRYLIGRLSVIHFFHVLCLNLHSSFVHDRQLLYTMYDLINNSVGFFLQLPVHIGSRATYT